MSGSTTVTYVTPDHRYFMRRTKREIISQIEQMTGHRHTDNEWGTLMLLPKDKLASMAINAYRALPAPPDPVDVVIAAIRTEIERQCDMGEAGNSYCTPSVDQDRMFIDATVDLRKLAQAVLKGA